jgi:hypothetical protein
VTDEVISRYEQVRHDLRIRLEVDAIGRGIGREAWSLDDDELKALGERALAGPRPVPADDASVNQNEPWHRLILRADLDMLRV